MIPSLPCRLWFLLLAVAVACVASAQQTAFQVQVLDSADRAPIADVAIANKDGVRWITDAQGMAVVTGSSSMLFHFSHTSYRPRELRMAGLDPSQVHVVLLVPGDLLLPAITVGRAAPEEVFRRADLHAADLLVNDAGLWVLAYEHPRMVRAEGDAGKEILRDVRLVLLDTLFHEVASCAVPEEVLGLRTDLRNEALIEGTLHAFSVARTADGIALQPFTLEELHNSVLPWTDSIPGKVVGSNANADYPALDHVAYNPVRDTLQRICTVVDSFMMDLFRSEYKYLKGPDKVLAMNLASELGVDKETVAGYMSGFSRNIWYQPLYAPLFVEGDTLLVFDHARRRLRKFTRAFVEARSVQLSYQGGEQARNWTGHLLQDRITRQVYAEFLRNGVAWLRAIDPVTGRMGDPFRLAVHHPQRVQVHGGKVYYIWRPVGTLQKRTIYREEM